MSSPFAPSIGRFHASLFERFAALSFIILPKDEKSNNEGRNNEKRDERKGTARKYVKKRRKKNKWSE